MQIESQSNFPSFIVNFPEYFSVSSFNPSSSFHQATLRRENLLNIEMKRKMFLNETENL